MRIQFAVAKVSLQIFHDLLDRAVHKVAVDIIIGSFVLVVIFTDPGKDRIGFGQVIFHLRNKADLQHGIEHLDLSLSAVAFIVDDRVIGGRRVEKTGQKRTLG